MHTPTAFILRCAASPCHHCLLLPLLTPSYPLAPSFPPLNRSFSYTLETRLSLSSARAILTLLSSSFAALLSFFLYYSRRIFTLLQLQLNSHYCYFLWWLSVKRANRVFWSTYHLSLQRKNLYLQYIHTYVHTYAHTYIQAYIHIYITYVHKYIHMYTIHMYIYIYTHECNYFIRTLAQILIKNFINFCLRSSLKSLAKDLVPRVTTPVRATMSYIATPMMKRVYIVGYSACAGTHVTTYT